MTVEVTFCVNINRDLCVSEEEINANFDTFRLELLEDGNYYGEVLNGAVVISSPGQPDIRVEDELEATVHNLCFQFIPDLVAEKHIVVTYFRYYGYLRLDPEGDYVLLSGDSVPMVRILRDELAPALYNCGLRFIKFWRRLRDDPAYEEIFQDFEGLAEVARQSLESKKLKIGLSD
ncbi:hypothetical protein [Coleofasciculus sp. G1-WW12-02]|uniref:hypothetical protein n=1 Tax=unclassified Coleofasciculus TaxID=2692782 RepID=UPI0039F7A727